MSDWQSHPHPIDPQVREIIMQKLATIEAEQDVRILFACESGSRGWGFASPDSDYDVRFIYVHRLPWYLTIDDLRDVIELPISDVLDIGGWDLRKSLALLRKGNATLVEWLDSPVIYRADTGFVASMRAVIQTCHQPERSFHHYVHMARKNNREHLQGDTIRLKKYLYVLRPLLAAQWVAQGRGVAPMRFMDLVEGLVIDADVRLAIEQLLHLKRQASESAVGPPVPALQAFIAQKLDTLADTSLPLHAVPSAPLNDLLYRTVVGA
jgi:uncharacterized protein